MSEVLVQHSSQKLGQRERQKIQQHLQVIQNVQTVQQQQQQQQRQLRLQQLRQQIGGTQQQEGNGTTTTDAYEINESQESSWNPR